MLVLYHLCLRSPITDLVWGVKGPLVIGHIRIPAIGQELACDRGLGAGKCASCLRSLLVRSAIVRTGTRECEQLSNDSIVQQ